MTIELPEGYKPTKKEDYMSAQHLEYFRQKLLDWRAELLQESDNTISHLKEENWQEPDINDRAHWKPMPRWNYAHAIVTAS